MRASDAVRHRPPGLRCGRLVITSWYQPDRAPFHFGTELTVVEDDPLFSPMSTESRIEAWTPPELSPGVSGSDRSSRARPAEAAGSPYSHSNIAPLNELCENRLRAPDENRDDPRVVTLYSCVEPSAIPGRPKRKRIETAAR
jgi:hypothetical protein